jgi:hypothetical protein
MPKLLTVRKRRYRSMFRKLLALEDLVEHSWRIVTEKLSHY